jgi:putative membrane protein
MERKLYYGITTPGGVATVLLGIWMLVDYGWAAFGHMLWLQIKLALIALLVIYHLYCGKLVTDFKHERNRHSHVWFRWFNELPVLALIAIVLLAVLKPA